MRGRQEKEEEYFYDDTEEGSDDGQSGDYLGWPAVSDIQGGSLDFNSQKMN